MEDDEKPTVCFCIEINVGLKVIMAFELLMLACYIGFGVYLITISHLYWIKLIIDALITLYMLVRLGLYY